MISPQPDDWEYPYAARYREAEEVDAAPAPRRRLKIPWHSLWRWTKRGAMAGGVLLLLVILAASFPLYRAARQAWLIADLEEYGCLVYLHDPPEYAELLPEFVQERFGENWWSEVRAVEVGDSLLFSLSANDVQWICEACSEFRRLERFCVSSDQFSCDLIVDWPQLDRLQQLDIESSKVRDADLAVLGRMQNLEKLTIARAKFGGEGMTHLAKAPNLKRLTLDRLEWQASAPIDEPGFASLRALAVQQSPSMNDDAIVAFGPLPQLDEVNFHRTPIGDRGLAHVLSSGKVNSLIIGEGALTDASLAVVAQYPAPRWLVLSQMRLTDRGLQSLAGKQFGTLILSNASITDEGFRALAEIHGLEYVCLRANPITGIGVRHLKADQPLSHLDLSGAPLTPEGIAALANLQCSELVLARTPLDDEGLMLLVENDFLTRLDVTETQITLEGAKAFYEARKNRRHQDAEETLWLICDYPEVLEAITGAEAIGGPYGYGSLGQSPY